MKRKIATILILASVCSLQGCTSFRANNQATNEPSRVISSQEPYLKACLKNADELAKLDEKKKSKHDEIYNLINEAKSFSKFAGQTSGGVERTIAPLFEYKINYTCNGIENLLIETYNNKVKNTELFRDKK